MLSIVSIQINIASMYFFERTKTNTLLTVIGIICATLTLMMRIFMDERNSTLILTIYYVLGGLSGSLLSMYATVRCFSMLYSKIQLIAIIMQPYRIIGFILGCVIGFGLVPAINWGIGFLILGSTTPAYFIDFYCFYLIIRGVRSNPAYRANFKQRRILKLSNILFLIFLIAPFTMGILFLQGSWSWFNTYIIGISILLMSISDILLFFNKITADSDIIWLSSSDLKTSKIAE